MGRIREKCIECGQKRPKTKMVDREFPSKIPGKVYKRKVCRICDARLDKAELAKKKKQAEMEEHMKSMEEKVKKDMEEKKTKAEAEKTKPKISDKPYPQSIQTDEKVQGYVHQKKAIIDVPKNLQENGRVVIDIARLPNQVKQQLGNGVMNFVRQETGGRCYEVEIDIIGFRYKVKHTKPLIVEETESNEG